MLFIRFFSPPPLPSRTVQSLRMEHADVLLDRLSNSTKQHTSTVALVPPELVWEPIQQARTHLKDKGLYRWPPHINLLYPFLPTDDFEDAVTLLAPAIAQLSSPEITLDALDCVGHQIQTQCQRPCLAGAANACIVLFARTVWRQITRRAVRPSVCGSRNGGASCHPASSADRTPVVHRAAASRGLHASPDHCSLCLEESCGGGQGRAELVADHLHMRRGHSPHAKARRQRPV